MATDMKNQNKRSLDFLIACVNPPWQAQGLEGPLFFFFFFFSHFWYQTISHSDEKHKPWQALKMVITYLLSGWSLSPLAKWWQFIVCYYCFESFFFFIALSKKTIWLLINPSLSLSWYLGTGEDSHQISFNPCYIHQLISLLNERTYCLLSESTHFHEIMIDISPDNGLKYWNSWRFSLFLTPWEFCFASNSQFNGWNCLIIFMLSDFFKKKA